MAGPQSDTKYLRWGARHGGNPECGSRNAKDAWHRIALADDVQRATGNGRRHKSGMGVLASQVYRRQKDCNKTGYVIVLLHVQDTPATVGATVDSKTRSNVMDAGGNSGTIWVLGADKYCATASRRSGTAGK